MSSLCWGCECGVELCGGLHVEYRPEPGAPAYTYPCKFNRSGLGVTSLDATCRAVLESPKTELIDQFVSELSRWYAVLRDESEERRELADPTPAPRVRKHG